MSNEILVFNIAIIAWLKANSKMVTTPMKNSHVSRESDQGCRSQKILRKIQTA